MTAKKNLKRRIRERQAKTGESYTAARARVVAQAEPADDADKPKPGDDVDKPKPGAFPVVELIDASGDAAALGLKCDVLVSPLLAQRVSPARVLEQLRNALMATEHDPQLELLRGLSFRGERPIRQRPRLPNWWEGVRRFLARAEAGIGGITEAGDMLAFTVEGVMVIAQAGYVPDMPAIPRLHTQRHRLFLTSADAHHIDGSAIVLPR